jgi:hypothetical protein
VNWYFDHANGATSPSLVMLSTSRRTWTNRRLLRRDWLTRTTRVAGVA